VALAHEDEVAPWIHALLRGCKAGAQAAINTFPLEGGVAAKRVHDPLVGTLGHERFHNAN
jgi:hypothetical protein